MKNLNRDEMMKSILLRSFDFLKKENVEINKPCKNIYLKKLNHKKLIQLTKLISLDLMEAVKAKKYTYNVNVTLGNGKLVNIPSISFMPFITCLDMKCLSFCYGCGGNYLQLQKFINIIENTLFYLYNSKEFVKRLDAWFEFNQPKYFRFFEDGDLVSSEMMIDFMKICKKNKNTNFLVMTKKYQFLDIALKEYKQPKNLKIRKSLNSFSNDKKLQKQYNKNELFTDVIASEKENKKGWFLCPCATNKHQKCKDCLACWKLDKNISFKIHP